MKPLSTTRAALQALCTVSTLICGGLLFTSVYLQNERVVAVAGAGLIISLILRSACDPDAPVRKK